tara:strand:+ start:179 stop:859 length:681 start_codon:yes stop_codon:yes gene_type:complete
MPATKECFSCGAQNDVIFTNCVFCKTSLPTLDDNSLTNDELVMKSSEWIGKSSEPMLVMQGPNANEWTGKGIVRMMQAEIIGNAEKYLNLLEIRATSNPTLKVTYQGLRDKLDKNSKSGSKKKVMQIALPFLVVVLITGMIFYMASVENDDEIKYQEKLDKVEIQIEDALKEKNYDYSLILIEKLVWDHEIRLEQNQKKAESYDRKRESLKETVLTLKKKNQDGNN